MRATHEVVGAPPGFSPPRAMALDRLVRLLSVAGALLWFAVASSALAREHWFSGPVPAQPREGHSLSAAVPTPKLFDLVVSYHGDPQGDSDGLTTGCDLTTDDPQDRIECAFGHFADAVCESTEGAHHIRRVRVYRKGAQNGIANILWRKDGGWPRAFPNGLSRLGFEIYMYDLGERIDCDENTVLDRSFEDAITAGYALAHEWGHYAYGLRDENKTGEMCPKDTKDPRPTDKAVEPSLMASPWCATRDYDEARMSCPQDKRQHVLEDSRWLNFSIKNDGDGGEFQDTRETAHHRQYKESAWETLARDDITEKLDRWAEAWPLRRFYPELAAVAPPNGETPMFDPARDQISPSGCRDDLEIIWMKPDNVYQIVLDKSGSMAGTGITNARNAAKLLVDLAQEGTTTIGVIAFDSQPRLVAPLTAVLDAATKTSLKAAIDTITAGGTTAIGEGAQKALDDLSAFGGIDSNRFVYLLSDGENNAGRDPLSVIPAYQASQVPIFSFAYGAGADLGVLAELAESTEGQLFVSPTTSAEIEQAFEDANTAATGIAAISTGEAIVHPNASLSLPFEIDSTIVSLATTVVYSPATAAFELISPSGQRFAPGPPRTLSGGKSRILFDLDAPAAGTWQLQGRASTQPASFSFRVSGVPAGETYVLSGELTSGSEVSYPAPMLLVASLHRDLPILGADVHAEVTGPDGNVSALPLSDDGNPPDAAASDGLYSGAFAYGIDGVYEFLVTATGEAGLAAETVNGLAVSPAPDGSGVLPPPDIPLVEDLERFVRFQATARGVVQDDHGDTPALATEIGGENLQVTPGRIEVGGDVDVFAVDLSPDADAAGLRISGLALDMDPLVRVLASDESTVLAQGTLATHSANRGYLLLEVKDRAGQRVFAEVAHRDANSGTGTYEVSAGRLMDVDLEALDCPVTPAKSCLRSGASKLSLKDGNPAAPGPKDSVSWSWLRGPGLTKSDFADPTDATDYALCIYADSGAITSEANLPADETCSGAPCWTPLKTAGFRYADRAATWSGITSLSLAGGDPGKSKIVLKGKGQNLNLPALPLDSSAGVVVQLRNSAGSCWESVFPPSSISKNTGNQFSATSP